MIKKGDLVVLRAPFWHQGSDIGNRLGIVIDDTRHLLVDVSEYPGNPVKCFRSEVSAVLQEDEEPIAEVEWDPWSTKDGD